MLAVWPVRLVAAVILCGLSSAAMAEDWPRFRGPTGQGVSSEKNLPLNWGPEENIAWKTEIPGEGWSSPIVYGDNIFVTATTDEGRRCHVICLDRITGQVRWNAAVFEQEVRKKRAENSHATPTPVTDGKYVYAVFSSGGIAAVDYAGRLVWTNHEVDFYSHHGLSASPILYEDLLIMPFDGSSSGENNRIGWKIPWEKAVVLAVDKHTGKVRWRGKRGLSRIGHVTPNILVENGQALIVSGCGDRVQAFQPETGELVWSIYSQGEGVTPSIVIGDGLVFSCSGFEAPTIRVVRTGGQGDVTKTHIAWEQTRGVPSMASPLYVKPYLYAVTDAGIATCYEAATGKVVWQQRIGGKYSSSPVYADGKIYFLDENQGDTLVIAAGPEFQELARNTVGEKCQASMAISQGNIFIRSEKHLFCIGPQPKKN